MFQDKQSQYIKTTHRMWVCLKRWIYCIYIYISIYIYIPYLYNPICVYELHISCFHLLRSRILSAKNTGLQRSEYRSWLKNKVIQWETTIFQFWLQWTTTSNKCPKRNIPTILGKEQVFIWVATLNQNSWWSRTPRPVTLQGERLSTLHPVWVVPLQLGRAPGCSYHHCGIGLMLKPQVMSSCQPSTNWSKIEIFHQLVVEPPISKILKIRIFRKKKKKQGVKMTNIWNQHLNIYQLVE